MAPTVTQGTDTPSRTGRTGPRHQLKQLAGQYGIVISFLLISVALALSNPYFLRTGNILNVLRQVSINGILATGMTFVILTGGIDLSIGSILAASSMVGASFVVGENALSPALAIPIGLVVGAGFGVVNGVLIAAAGLPPFVMTLGMLSMARGFTLIYSGGMPIPDLSDSFSWIGQATLGGLPVPVLIFAAVFVAAWVVLRTTVYGRWIYAVGGNIRSAKTSGINTRLVVFSVYVIMGILSALAGLVLAARVSTALPQAGLSYELDAIAAVVIGGTSLTGGVGSIVYTLVGVLIIGVINNGLDLMAVSSYYQQVIKGLIIVVAVLIDRSRQAA